MAIKTIRGRRNILRDDFLLTDNCFRVSEIYNVDQPGPYDSLMYGKQYQEFYNKFFLNPLMKETNRQIIGAIWSTYSANRLGKGYGKSMLMGEESKLINKDFGAKKLAEFGVDEDDIDANPIVAGYCSFKEATEVKSFPAALLEGVSFILRSEFGGDPTTETVHRELRRRIAKRIDAEEGYEGESVRRRLESEVRRYRSLGVQLSHREIKLFIQLLCGDNTTELVRRMADIGPRIKAAQGFNFVHIFNVFLRLAGIDYVVYFVDQIENFAKYARKQEQNIRILRESISETAPTRDMASFVFQMHVEAQHAIEDWWDNIEHLPSLDAKKRINATRVVELQGLRTKKEAILLAKKYLAGNRVPGAKVSNQLHPFNEDIIEAVLRSEAGNPRQFLQTLGRIIDNAIGDTERKLDLSYVQPFLEDIPEAVVIDDDEEEYSNIER